MHSLHLGKAQVRIYIYIGRCTCLAKRRFGAGRAARPIALVRRIPGIAASNAAHNALTL